MQPSLQCSKILMGIKNMVPVTLAPPDVVVSAVFLSISVLKIGINSFPFHIWVCLSVVCLAVYPPCLYCLLHYFASASFLIC